MAFSLSNLSPSILQSNSREKSIFHYQSLHHLKPASLPAPATASLAHTSLHCPPAQLNTPPDNQHKRDDFYVNLGAAVRTLREDIPLIFAKDLNYEIYRDDITFIDPLNTFAGIENYKLIFWALRFHGKVLFREISLEVYRIWQPSETEILIRWNMKGTPRVPWETNGQFQGTSRYKLDRNGKIYQHKVDNFAFNFPQQLKPAASVLDLVTACPASPNPTFLWGRADVHTSSWVEFYRAVKETITKEQYLLSQHSLVTCS